MSKIKVGDLVLAKAYVKVSEVRINSKDPNKSEILVDSVDRDQKFLIIGDELINELDSADSFVKEEKTTLTKIAEIMSTSYSTPFTVCFNKKITVKEQKEGKKEGKERTLRGRLVTPEPLLGRSKVEDLDVEEEYKMRLVDHRTINWLIVNGIKYTKKK